MTDYCNDECESCELCEWRKCGKCGGWDCQGCLDSEDLRVLNAQILANAKRDLICPIASRSYVVPNKRKVELKIPRYLRYTRTQALEEADEIMCRDAKLLEEESK